MTESVTASDFAELGLDDWRVLLNRIEANFRTGSYAAAGALAAKIAALADEQDHHPTIDVRYPDLVHVASTTHFRGGITDRDVRLARAISDLASTLESVTSEPVAGLLVEIAIDALDIPAVAPFWAALLGYDPPPSHRDGEPVWDLFDPRGVTPTVWFQPMDEPRPQRNRLHVDVVVPHDVAEQRVLEALDAGGRLVSDAQAPSFWVLADPEGNEACVCTWQDPA